MLARVSIASPFSKCRITYRADYGVGFHITAFNLCSYVPCSLINRAKGVSALQVLHCVAKRVESGARKTFLFESLYLKTAKL